jgi:hypothetical protein
MQERICKVPLTYAGRGLAAGERFQCEDKDITVLLAAGFIEHGEAIASAVEPGYRTRDMAASAPPEYLTRDMTHRKRGRPRKAA